MKAQISHTIPVPVAPPLTSTNARTSFELSTVSLSEGSKKATESIASTTTPTVPSSLMELKQWVRSISPNAYIIDGLDPFQSESFPTSNPNSLLTSLTLSTRVGTGRSANVYVCGKQIKVHDTSTMANSSCNALKNKVRPSQIVFKHYTHMRLTPSVIRSFMQEVPPHRVLQYCIDFATCTRSVSRIP